MKIPESPCTEVYVDDADGSIVVRQESNDQSVWFAPEVAYLVAKQLTKLALAEINKREG